MSIAWDKLDNDNFNPIDFLNDIFPTERSKNRLDDVSKVVKEKIDHLDGEMSEAVRKQSLSRTKGKEQLDNAHKCIDVLFILLNVYVLIGFKY
jgi:hypothetical protein